MEAIKSLLAYASEEENKMAWPPRGGSDLVHPFPLHEIEENCMEVQNPALGKCGPINFLESVQSSEYVFSGRKQRPGRREEMERPFF